MNQKQKKKINCINIICFVLFITALVIPIIHYSLNLLTNYQTWFWVFMLLVPLGLIEFYNLIENNPLYEKQKRLIKKNLIISCISLWAISSFIYTIVVNDINASIILGIVIFLSLTFSLIASFIKMKKININALFILLADFLFSIVIIIYLLAKIPNDIQKIVLPIISSLYGGLLALVGVGLSIKNSQKENNDQLILQNKPLIFIINETHLNNQNVIDAVLENMNLIGDNFKSEKLYSINRFFIQNVDYSYSSIIGIKINDDVISYPISQCLQKNTIYSIDNINFNYESDIKSISLILQDMINNIYIYDLKFIIDKNNKIAIECGLGSITIL